MSGWARCWCIFVGLLHSILKFSRPFFAPIYSSCVYQACDTGSCPSTVPCDTLECSVVEASLRSCDNISKQLFPSCIVEKQQWRQRLCRSWSLPRPRSLLWRLPRPRPPVALTVPASHVLSPTKLGCGALPPRAEIVPRFLYHDHDHCGGNCDSRLAKRYLVCIRRFLDWLYFPEIVWRDTRWHVQ